MVITMSKTKIKKIINSSITEKELKELYNPIKFIETVLLNNKRKLYNYQKYWITLFFKNAKKNNLNPNNARKFYNIVNKTRQCGYSTIYKYMVLYFCLMQKKQAFYIFSKDNTAAKRFLRDIKDMYLRIDPKYNFLKKELIIDNKNEIVFADNNGASGNMIQALSVTSGIRSMDSGANIHICVDEMNFIPDNLLKDLLHGIEPMYSFIKKYPFSSLTFISTPLLTDSEFYKYWSSIDKNLRKIKIMWYEIEDRYLKDSITTRMVLDYIEKNPYYTQKELVDLFAIDWLKDIYYKDEEVFLSEYACVFLDLKDCYIDGKIIDNALKDREYLEYTTEDLLSYAETKYGKGGFLISGYDPSLGKATSDKCIITTFYYLEETNMFYQLSKQELKMPTPEQRKYIGVNLLEKYGDRHLLAIDSGGMGGSIYQEFVESYKNHNIFDVFPSVKNRLNGFTHLRHLLINKNMEFTNDITIKKDIKKIKEKKGLNNTLFEIKRDKNDNSHADLAYAIMLVAFIVWHIKDKSIELKTNNYIEPDFIDLDFLNEF